MRTEDKIIRVILFFACGYFGFHVLNSDADEFTKAVFCGGFGLVAIWIAVDLLIALIGHNDNDKPSMSC